MTFFFMNNIGYIFIVRRLGKQFKLILSRSDSISNLELNLKKHGPCGSNAHAGADLQAFLFFCFKPILLSAHKLILLIYGDNSTLNATPLLCRTDRAVTTCHLPQSHRGAWSYPKDLAYSSTTLVYEVTTLVSPSLPRPSDRQVKR